MARKYHPDLGGDIEKMKEVNNAVSEINNIKLIRLAPPPQPQSVVIHINFANNDIYTSTSTTGFTGTGSTWPF